MKVEVSDLGKSISDIANQYSQDVIASLDNELEKTADQILEFIKTNAPRSGRSNALADSFIKESFGEGSDKRIVIYSKKKGHIAHLIEFGFKHKGGKKISAKPFMRPAFDKFAPEMIEKMKLIIGGKS